MKKVLLTEREYIALKQLRLHENFVSLTQEERNKLKNFDEDEDDIADLGFIIDPPDYVSKFGLDVVSSELEEDSIFFLENMPSKIKLFEIYKNIFKLNLTTELVYYHSGAKKRELDPGYLGNISTDADRNLFFIVTRDGDSFKGYKYFNTTNPDDLTEITDPDELDFISAYLTLPDGINCAIVQMLDANAE